MENRRFEEFFDRVTDIFKKSLEEKGIKENIKITNTTEWKGIVVDMPREEEKLYHGSSYEILCNISKTWCKIKGDLVVDEEHDYEAIKALEESDCRIFGTHTHVQRKEGKPLRRESHLHFMCADKDRNDTIRMINFLKNY